MATYSIRDLEKLSGIKAHTIRIWEQRYGIIEPKRTQTNIRYYTDDDLQYLLNVAFLNRNGLRISKIATMTRDSIQKKVETISNDSNENTNHLQALTMAMVELSEEKFESIVASSIEKEGFEDCLLELIIPFLEKLSLLWLTGSISPVHEEFISGLIRQKILAQLENISSQRLSKEQKVLLYQPEGEDQEIMLIIANYLLRKRGYFTLFLGNNTSLADLDIAVKIFGPHQILTTVSDNNSNKHSVSNYLMLLHQRYSQLPVLVLGQSITRNLDFPEMVYVFEDFNDLIEQFDSV